MDFYSFWLVIEAFHIMLYWLILLIMNLLDLTPKESVLYLRFPYGLDFIEYEIK